MSGRPCWNVADFGPYGRESYVHAVKVLERKLNRKFKRCKTVDEKIDAIVKVANRYARRYGFQACMTRRDAEAIDLASLGATWSSKVALYTRDFIYEICGARVLAAEVPS